MKIERQNICLLLVWKAELWKKHKYDKIEIMKSWIDEAEFTWTNNKEKTTLCIDVDGCNILIDEIKQIN